MSRDAVEELRLIAPFIETPSQSARARQRRKLTEAIAAESTLSGRQRPLDRAIAAAPIRPFHLRRHGAYLAGAAAAIVAAAVLIPLSLGTTGVTQKTPSAAKSPASVIAKGAAPVMKLARYEIRLPNNYRLTSTKAAGTTCDAPAGFPGGVGFASPGSPGGSTGARTFEAPTYASQVAAAASAEGGCVWMALAPPYTPTAANPDPEAGAFENSPPVQVGPYEGRAGTWTAVYKPTGANSQEAALYVEIPLAGGQMQDLGVSSFGLTESGLISLVANGLSVAGATTNSTSSNSTT